MRSNAESRAVPLGGSRVAAHKLAFCCGAVMFLTRLGSPCSVVHVEVYPSVNASVQLRFTEKGKPLKGATIEMYLGQPSPTNDLPFEILTTKADGTAVTSELTVALFHLIVHVGGTEKGRFILDVPLQGESQFVERDVTLVATPVKPLAGAIASNSQYVAMAAPLHASLQMFHGIVADVTGAIIPDTDIRVYPRGGPYEEPIARIHTEGSGEFVKDLDKGEYIAVFSRTGFSVQPVEFSVGSDGWKGLRLTLQIGGGSGSCISPQGVITEY